MPKKHSKENREYETDLFAWLLVVTILFFLSLWLSCCAVNVSVALPSRPQGA